MKISNLATIILALDQNNKTLSPASLLQPPPPDWMHSSWASPPFLRHGLTAGRQCNRSPPLGGWAPTWVSAGTAWGHCHTAAVQNLEDDHSVLWISVQINMFYRNVFVATVAELVMVPYQWSEDNRFEYWLNLS